MTKRSMVRLVGAIVLATVLGLGVPAPSPAAADPADTYLPWNTTSRLYTPHGCLYRVAWGNFGAQAYAMVLLYDPSACGTFAVSIQHSGGLIASSVTVVGSGTDSCGSYQAIQVNAPVPSVAERAFIAFTASGGYSRWYDTDGTHTQPGITC